MQEHLQAEVNACNASTLLVVEVFNIEAWILSCCMLLRDHRGISGLVGFRSSL